MIVDRIPFEYEIKTRNLNIMNYLDIMTEKYGINDYALSTVTTWERGSVEIYPAENNKTGKGIESRAVKKYSDLLLQEYIQN